jgi:flagellar biosynthesis protein FlhG
MDQAERLRNLMHGTARRARVLAVSSGKGGAGKTNISVNLAIAFARLGKGVVIADVDIGLANADVVLGVHPRHTLRDVLAGEVGVKEALTPAAAGVQLLAGSTGMPMVSDLEEAERGFLIRSFQELEESADIIILDTGAGITRNVIHFAAAAGEVLVVTTPEPTAITDAYALIKTLSREKGFGRLRLLVNQAVDRLEAERVAQRIGLVSRRFLDLEVEGIGYVLADVHVGLAVRRKRPFLLEYPAAPASECLRRVAERLCAAPVARPSGFAERLTAMAGKSGGWN